MDTISKPTPKTKMSSKRFDALCNTNIALNLKTLKENGVKITNVVKDKVKANVENDLRKSFTLSGGGINNTSFYTPQDQDFIAEILDFIKAKVKASKTNLTALRPQRKDVKKPYSMDNLTGLIEKVRLGHYINQKGEKDIVPTPIEKSNIEKVIGMKLPPIKKTKKVKKSNKK